MQKWISDELIHFFYGFTQPYLLSNAAAFVSLQIRLRFCMEYDAYIIAKVNESLLTLEQEFVFYKV